MMQAKVSLGERPEKTANIEENILEAGRRGGTPISDAILEHLDSVRHEDYPCP